MTDSLRSQSPAGIFNKLPVPVGDSTRGSSPIHAHPLGMNAIIERKQQTPDKYSKENNYGYGKEESRRSISPMPSHPLDRAASPVLHDREKIERSKSPEHSASTTRAQQKSSPEVSPPPFQDLMETLETPIKFSHSISSSQEITNKSEQEQEIEPKKDETQGWVTIFGFSRSQSESILKEFRSISIGEYQQCSWGPADSNWVHLLYKDPHSHQRALQRNGYLIGGTVMIGVMPYAQFLESHKMRQGVLSTMTSVPLRSGLLKDSQTTNSKAVKPLLQQPISVVTRELLPIPQTQSFLYAALAEIFGW